MVRKWYAGTLLLLLICYIYVKSTAKAESFPIENFLLKEINALLGVKETCEHSSRLAETTDFNCYYTQFSRYSVPVQFANFRSFHYEGCKTNTIFASASPWCSSNGRSLAANKIGEELKMGFEVNLECGENGLDYQNIKHLDFTKYTGWTWWLSTIIS